jgi:hypothetical protein
MILKKRRCSSRDITLLIQVELIGLLLLEKRCFRIRYLINSTE